MKKKILLTVLVTSAISALLLALSSYMSKDLQVKPIDSLDQLYLSKYISQGSAGLSVSTTDQNADKLVPYTKESYVSAQTAQNTPYSNYKYEGAYLPKESYYKRLDFSEYYGLKTVISLCKDEYFYTSEVGEEFITHNQSRDHEYLLNRKLSDIAKCNVSVLKFDDTNLLQNLQTSKDFPAVLSDHRLALSSERSYTIDENGQAGILIEVKEKPAYYAQRYLATIKPFDDYLLEFKYQAHDTLNLRYGVRLFTQKYLDRQTAMEQEDYDPIAWSDIDNEYTEYYFDIANEQSHLLQQVVSTNLEDVIGVEVIYYADSCTNARYSFGMPSLYSLVSQDSIDEYKQEYSLLAELVKVDLPAKLPVSELESPFYILNKSVQSEDGIYTTDVYIASNDYALYLLEFDGKAYTITGEFGEMVVEDYDCGKVVIGDIALGKIMNLSLKSDKPVDSISLEKATFYDPSYSETLFKLDKTQFTSGDYKLVLLEKPYSLKYYIADSDYYHYMTNGNQNLFLINSDITIYPIGYKTAESIRILAFLIIPIGVFIMLVYLNRSKIVGIYKKINKSYIYINTLFSRKISIPLLKFVFDSKEIKYKHIFDTKSKFWGEIDMIIEKIVTDVINKPLGLIFIVAGCIPLIFALSIPLKSIAILIVFAIMLIWLLYGWDSRVLGLVALIFLCAVPVLLILKKDGYAEGFAIMVYFFLVANVAVQVKEGLEHKQ